MASRRPDDSLRGWQVLVTRPAGVADALCTALAAHGATVQRAPLLAIEELPETAADRGIAQSLDRCDFVIVTSRHAVQHGVARLAAFWPQWPAGVQWLAVGAATAAALAAEGIHAQAPDDARSEGLLALPQLTDIAGRRVLLLTGENGRGLLETTLAARGAQVLRLAAYRRRANPDVARTLDLFAGAAAAPGRAVLVTSRDALQNLVELALWLPDSDVQVVVASARIADAAQQAGLRHITVAAGADDAALIDALLALAAVAAGKPQGEDRA